MSFIVTFAQKLSILIIIFIQTIQRRFLFCANYTKKFFRLVQVFFQKSIDEFLNM